MTDQTANERGRNGADIAAGLRERGIEQAEHAKERLADGADRAAAAVERTADELEGDAAISGAGRSIASLMRQFAGGLRERDVNEFAHELGTLARRNPGMFLGGAVALGFGIARFFKADPSENAASAQRAADRRQRYAPHPSGARREPDAEESLDLSSAATGQVEPVGRGDDEHDDDANRPSVHSAADRSSAASSHNELTNGADRNSANGGQRP